MNRLAYKFYGQPPPRGAPPSQALRWVRRFYIRPLPFLLVAGVWIIVSGPPTWALVMLAAVAVAWGWGIASLTRRMRREERREQSETSR